MFFDYRLLLIPVLLVYLMQFFCLQLSSVLSSVRSKYRFRNPLHGWHRNVWLLLDRGDARVVSSERYHHGFGRAFRAQEERNSIVQCTRSPDTLPDRVRCSMGRFKDLPVWWSLVENCSHAHSQRGHWMCRSQRCDSSSLYTWSYRIYSPLSLFVMTRYGWFASLMTVYLPAFSRWHSNHSLWSCFLIFAIVYRKFAYLCVGLMMPRFNLIAHCRISISQPTVLIRVHY